MGRRAGHGRKFVFVIDEWDAPYRLAQGQKAAQDAYAEWLRALFKSNTLTPVVVAGAYMTGILPIKKYAHQSAVSDFWEYTMVRPGAYVPYVGFTEAEVLGLCAEHGLDPADVLRAIGGEELRINTARFQNDMTSVASRDDALTLLVHLGYLCYDIGTGRARVPNEEVRHELRRAVGRSRSSWWRSNETRTSMHFLTDMALSQIGQLPPLHISRPHPATSRATFSRYPS